MFEALLCLLNLAFILVLAGAVMGRPIVSFLTRRGMTIQNAYSVSYLVTLPAVLVGMIFLVVLSSG